jgi:DNA invertase Pin-like site-specific DNA recombinase
LFDLNLRVVYYARVSTEKDAQLNSLDNQVYYFENFIQGNPNWKFAGSYIDEGISGKSAENRESFMRMIKDAKAGIFDLVITKEISRFARNTLDSIQYTRELLYAGVGVYFQNDNINTIDEDSEIRLSIMSSIAQDEIRKLSERLRFGYKRAIEKRRVLGQDNLIGYNKHDGVLTINEDEAVVVRRVFDIYNEGKLGVRAVSRQLEKEGFVSKNTGVMYPFSTIVNIITNPKYKGYYFSRKTVTADYRNDKVIRQPKEDWIVFKDENIPAIVSEEVWDRANKLYEERGRKAKENSQAYLNRYPFSGKIFCSEHGTSYHRHVYPSKHSGNQEVWNCKMYRVKGKDDGCASPTLYSRELIEILNKIYASIYDDRDEILEGLVGLYNEVDIVDYTKDIARIKLEMSRVDSRKDQLLDMHMDGTISRDEFKSRNDKMNSDLKKISLEHERLVALQGQALNGKSTLDDFKSKIRAVLSNKELLSAEVSNDLLEKITVHKVNGDRKHVKLEIVLNIGKTYSAELRENHLLSLQEIGICCSEMQFKYIRRADAYKGHWYFTYDVSVSLSA